MHDELTQHLSLERQFKLKTILTDIDKASDIDTLRGLTKELALQLLLTQQFISDSCSVFGHE